MTEFEMTVTQALVELKTLDDRIRKAITEATFIVAICPSNEPKSQEEIETSIKASYQKANDLIARRDAIKDALIISNAQTVLTVGGEEMSVAVAIDRKKSANELRRTLLREMGRQSSYAVNNFRTMTTNIESNARNLLKTMGVKPDEATDNDTAMAAYRAYLEANKVVLVDPLDITAVMEKLADKLDTFDRDVDVALSVKNATTIIKGSY